jgi:hypothetical protein
VVVVVRDQQVVVLQATAVQAAAVRIKTILLRERVRLDKGFLVVLVHIVQLLQAVVAVVQVPWVVQEVEQGQRVTAAQEHRIL